MLPDFVIYILSVPLGLLILYWFGLFLSKFDSSNEGTGLSSGDYDVSDDIFDDYDDDNWTKLDLQITRTRELLLKLKLEADKGDDNEEEQKRLTAMLENLEKMASELKQ